MSGKGVTRIKVNFLHLTGKCRWRKYSDYPHTICYLTGFASAFHVVVDARYHQTALRQVDGNTHHHSQHRRRRPQRRQGVGGQLLLLLLLLILLSLVLLKLLRILLLHLRITQITQWRRDDLWPLQSLPCSSASSDC